MKNIQAKRIIMVLAAGLTGLGLASLPVQTAAAFPTYPQHRNVMATMFYVGEDPSPNNDYISNHASAWDKNWVDHYGGVDRPYERNGWRPVGFTPKENPFYVALPYNDRSDVGSHKTSAEQNVPWFHKRDKSILKNFWVEVCFRERCAYGQWEDVGPGEVDDVGYVFGSDSPVNLFGLAAGIDLSPAMADYLHMADYYGKVSWRFMYPDTVPEGPWWDIPTTRW